LLLESIIGFIPTYLAVLKIIFEVILTNSDNNFFFSVINKTSSLIIKITSVIILIKSVIAEIKSVIVRIKSVIILVVCEGMGRR
jgi:hypothetical protein